MKSRIQKAISDHWFVRASVLVLMLLAFAHTAHAQVDPTTNFRMWGSPMFNRQIGPDDVVVQVAGGQYHTIALLEDGTVVCWGRGDFGQCRVPVGIGTSSNPATQVAAGRSHSMALLENGSLICWGENIDGQCKGEAKAQGNGERQG